MEAAATAVRIGSAAAASTSHPTQLSGLRVFRNPCNRTSCREAVRWRRVSEVCQIRANAVAREFVKAAKKRQQQQQQQVVEDVLLPVTHHQAVAKSSSTTGGGVSAWIGALASAVLAIEKQRRREEETSDLLRRGRLVENELVYRQAFVIRSYEAGFDKIASIETIANLFQETALNHVGLSTFVGDGMGTTHAMMRHRLIWVVTRMHVEVGRYPVWGDVVEIDSWVAAEGKNGMRRDFIVRDCASREVIAKATSTWVMMNQDTRRLSKMPQEVRDEISPFFLDRKCIKTEGCQKIKKLDDNAPYSRSDLVPRLRDMDMNQHVNNVKYISWVLESVPQSLLVAHELASMTLEYRRECTPSDVVQSLSCPDTHLGLFQKQSPSSPLQEAMGGLDGSPDAISCSSSRGALNNAPTTTDPVSYTHLLRMQNNGADIVHGKTKWRVKDRFVVSH